MQLNPLNSQNAEVYVDDSSGKSVSNSTRDWIFAQNFIDPIANRFILGQTLNYLPDKFPSAGILELFACFPVFCADSFLVFPVPCSHGLFATMVGDQAGQEDDGQSKDDVA